jgi:hypothetical protein
MRFSTLFILGFLVGCSGAPDSDTGTLGAGGSDTSNEPPGWYDDGPSGPGACGNAYDVIELQAPDGTVHQVTIPIPCDSFYIDKGDPPPDDFFEEEGEERGNPAPNQVLLQSQFVR